MSAPDYTKEKQRQKQHHLKPETTVIPEQIPNQTTITAIPAGPMGASEQPTIESQAAQLGDARMPLLQRQQMAGQIGQKFGNTHMQQVMRALKNNGQSASPVDISGKATSKTIARSTANQETNPTDEVAENEPGDLFGELGVLNFSPAVPPPVDNNNGTGLIQPKPADTPPEYSPLFQGIYDQSIDTHEANSPSPFIQTKLTVNTPGDAYEQEADQVADTVMRLPSPEPETQESTVDAANDQNIQRYPSEENNLQRYLANALTISRVERSTNQPPPKVTRQAESTINPTQETDQPLPEIQRQTQGEDNLQRYLASALTISRIENTANPPTPEVTPQTENNIKSMEGGGAPLPKGDRQFFESRFGQDFSQVRVHTDGKAIQASQDVEAKAFTVGNDIAFNKGEYQPGTQEGRRLIAHELTHTVQQTGGAPVGVQRSPLNPPTISRAKPSVIQRAFGFVGDFVGGVLNGAKSGIKSGIKGVAKIVVGGIKLVVDGTGFVIDTIGDGYEGIKELGKDIWNNSIAYAKKYGQKVLDWVMEAGEAVLTGIQKMGEKFVDLVTRTGDKLLQLIQQFGDQLITFIEQLGDAFIDLIIEIGDEIIAFINMLFKEFAHLVQKAVEWTIEQIKMLVSWVAELGRIILELVGELGNKFFDWFDRLIALFHIDFLKQLSEQGRGAFNTLIEGGIDLIDALEEYSQEFIDKLKEWGLEVIAKFEAIRKKLNEEWERIKEQIRHILETLLLEGIEFLYEATMTVVEFAIQLTDEALRLLVKLSEIAVDLVKTVTIRVLEWLAELGLDVEWLKEIILRIANWLDQIIETYRAIGQKIIDAVRTWSEEILTILEEWTLRMTEIFLRWVEIINQKLNEWGPTIIKVIKLLAGIGALDYLAEWVGDWVTTIGDWYDTFSSAAENVLFGMAKWAAESLGWIGELLGQYEGIISNWVKTFAGEAIDWLGEAAQKIVGWIDEWGKTVLDWITNSGGNFFTWVKEVGVVVFKLFEKWADKAGQWLIEHFTTLREWYQTFGDKLITWIEELGEDLFDVLSRWGGVFLTWVQNVGEVVYKLFSNWMDKAGEWLINYYTAFKTWYEVFGDKLIEWITNWGETIFETLKTWTGQLVAWLNEWGDQLLNWVEKWGVKLLDWLGGLKDSVYNLLTTYGEKIFNWFSEWGEILVSWFNTYKAQFFMWLDKLGDTLKEWYDALGSPIFDALRDIGEAVLEWIATMGRDLWNLIKEWGAPLVEWIKGWYRDLVEWVTPWIVKLYEWVKQWRDDVKNWLEQWNERIPDWVKTWEEMGQIDILDYLLGKFDGRVFEWLDMWGDNIPEWLVRWQDYLGVIQAWFENLGETLFGILDKWQAQIDGWLAKWSDYLIAWVNSWGEKVFEWLGRLKESISGWAENWIEALFGWIDSFGEKMFGWLDVWGEKLEKWLGDWPALLDRLPGLITEYQDKIFTWLDKFGQEVINLATNIDPSHLQGILTQLDEFVAWGEEFIAGLIIQIAEWEGEVLNSSEFSEILNWYKNWLAQVNTPTETKGLFATIVSWFDKWGGAVNALLSKWEETIAAWWNGHGTEATGWLTTVGQTAGSIEEAEQLLSERGSALCRAENGGGAVEETIMRHPLEEGAIETEPMRRSGERSPICGPEDGLQLAETSLSNTSNMTVMRQPIIDQMVTSTTPVISRSEAMCGPDYEGEEKEGSGEAKDISGAKIVAQPAVDVIAPGTTITYIMDLGESMFENEPAYQWYVLNDEESQGAVGPEFKTRIDGPTEATWEDAEWGFAGEHTVVCEIQFGEQPVKRYEYTQTVREAADINQETLAQITAEDTNYAHFRASLEVQNVLSEHQGSDKADELSHYLDLVDSEVSEIDDDRMLGLGVAYVSTETGQQFSPSLFVGPKEDDTGLKLVDLTPGVSRMQYEGNDWQDVLDTFERGNAYPAGTITIVAPANGLGVPPGEYRLETDGSSSFVEWASNLGWASLGLAVGGLAAAFISAPVAAPVLALAAITGVASSTLSIYDRIQQGEIDETGMAIDILGLISSLLGAGTAFQAIRNGRAVTLTSRSGTFFLWGSTGADLGAGVLIGEEIIESIIAVQENEYLSETEKQTQIANLLANAALIGGLVMLSTADAAGSIGKGGKNPTQGQDNFNIDSTSEGRPIQTPDERFAEVGQHYETLLNQHDELPIKLESILNEDISDTVKLAKIEEFEAKLDTLLTIKETYNLTDFQTIIDDAGGLSPFFEKLTPTPQVEKVPLQELKETVEGFNSWTDDQIQQFLDKDWWQDTNYVRQKYLLTRLDPDTIERLASKIRASDLEELLQNYDPAKVETLLGPITKPATITAMRSALTMPQLIKVLEILNSPPLFELFVSKGSYKQINILLNVTKATSENILVIQRLVEAINSMNDLGPILPKVKNLTWLADRIEERGVNLLVSQLEDGTLVKQQFVKHGLVTQQQMDSGWINMIDLQRNNPEKYGEVMSELRQNFKAPYLADVMEEIMNLSNIPAGYRRPVALLAVTSGDTAITDINTLDAIITESAGGGPQVKLVNLDDLKTPPSAEEKAKSVKEKAGETANPDNYDVFYDDGVAIVIPKTATGVKVKNINDKIYVRSSTIATSGVENSSMIPGHELRHLLDQDSLGKWMYDNLDWIDDVDISVARSAYSFLTEFNAYYSNNFRLLDLDERATVTKQYILDHYPKVKTAYDANENFKKLVDTHNAPIGDTTNAMPPNNNGHVPNEPNSTSLNGDDSIDNASLSLSGEGSKLNKRSDFLPEYVDVKVGKRLGEGEYKVAYAIDDELALVVLKPNKSLYYLDKEINTIQRLGAMDVPVLSYLGVTSYHGRPAAVVQRYAHSSKTIAYINGKGDLTETGGRSKYLNQQSIEDLDTIRRILTENGVCPDDLQFGITAEGRVLVTDPLSFKHKPPTQVELDLIEAIRAVAVENVKKAEKGGVLSNIFPGLFSKP